MIKRKIIYNNELYTKNKASLSKAGAITKLNYYFAVNSK